MLTESELQELRVQTEKLNLEAGDMLIVRFTAPYDFPEQAEQFIENLKLITPKGTEMLVLDDSFEIKVFKAKA